MGWGKKVLKMAPEQFYITLLTVLNDMPPACQSRFGIGRNKALNIFRKADYSVGILCYKSVCYTEVVRYN
ncbi:MAG: hypothetical protein A2080_07585 [Ignavibacteria bacterium GWC2_36_12]|nr:MAG: hypothetical protein A2080_07585 [Ignavibacteria bacterium GWC2_36_12]